MEADFEGSLHDVAGQDEDEAGSGDEDEDDAGERLDQQMGDVGEEGETVDERLWGNDKQPPQDADAKTERDSTVQVRAGRGME